MPAPKVLDSDSRYEQEVRLNELPFDFASHTYARGIRA